MRFCCNVLKNSGIIDIAMTILKNKLSFKLNQYLMRYMHVNTNNKTWAPWKFFILYFLF